MMLENRPDMLNLTAPIHREPDRLFTPEQVVETQLRALNHAGNGQSAFMEVAFAFTSPTNRKFVGPLEHYAKLMRSPVYEALLNFDRAELGSVLIIADIAQIRVRTAGKHGRAVFMFLLSLQSCASFPSCWMIDSITRDF